MKLLKFTIASASILLLLTGCGNEEKKTMHENGQIKQVAHYDDKNQLQDSFKQYDDKGTLTSDLVYKDNKILSGFQIVAGEVKIKDKVLKDVLKKTYKDGKEVSSVSQKDFKQDYINLIKENPIYVNYIPLKTVEMQMVAIGANPSIIIKIENPKDETIIKSLKNSKGQEHHIINRLMVKELSDNVAREFLTLKPNGYRYIAKLNSNTDIQLEELLKSKANFTYAINPSKETMKKYLDKYQDALKLMIQNKTAKIDEDIEAYAVNLHTPSVKYVKNPTKEMKLSLYAKDFYALYNALKDNPNLLTNEEIVYVLSKMPKKINTFSATFKEKITPEFQKLLKEKQPQLFEKLAKRFKTI